jgi:hypothetical protein
MENSARALLDKVNIEDEPKEDLDSDVIKLKNRIAERLEVYEDMIR